jgi:hypothetical protein
MTDFHFFFHKPSLVSFAIASIKTAFPFVAQPVLLTRMTTDLASIKAAAMMTAAVSKSMSAFALGPTMRIFNANHVVYRSRLARTCR